MSLKYNFSIKMPFKLITPEFVRLLEMRAILLNIAKGTTDPRVEIILPK